MAGLLEMAREKNSIAMFHGQNRILGLDARNGQGRRHIWLRQREHPIDNAKSYDMVLVAVFVLVAPGWE